MNIYLTKQKLLPDTAIYHSILKIHVLFDIQVVVRVKAKMLRSFIDWEMYFQLQ